MRKSHSLKWILLHLFYILLPQQMEQHIVWDVWILTVGMLDTISWIFFSPSFFCIRFTLNFQLSFLETTPLLLYRYLYTLDFPESRVISQPDQTLEILMSELDPAVMDQFYMKDGVTAKDVTRVSIFNNSGFCLGTKVDYLTHLV